MPESELNSENISEKSRNPVDFHFPILIIEIDQSKTSDPSSNSNKLKYRMPKKPVNKRHLVIKMSDLNKMFSENELICIPKSFARDIAYMLASHGVSLEELNSKPEAVNETETEPEFAEAVNGTKVQISETSFED